jgi:hypothetical protein
VLFLSVITGSGFTSNSTVLIGSNTACSVTYVSTTQLRAQVPSATPGSYPVYVVTGDGGTAIRVNALTYSDSPTWVTSSPLTQQVVDTSFSIQLSASGANTYSLQTGSSLPSGVSLAANGLLSGTVTGITEDTTYNFTVEAIDAEAQESPIALAITISGQYVINRSLRLRSAAAAYLSKTPASASNRRTYTWSAWVKRAGLSTADSTLFNAGTVVINETGFLGIRFTDEDRFDVTTGGTDLRRTTQVFRDTSAWYHFVVAMDTTQATAGNRVKIYVNGTQITSFTASNDPSLNLDTAINNNVVHEIGRTSWTQNTYFSGFMAEVCFIDGTALTPDSFGRWDANAGVWVPKSPSGLTYGTNGFYLPFSDNTSTTTLGNDASGRGNNWTLNNFSVASGVNNDSLVDSPTPNGTDTTGAGALVKGSYAILNPLAANGGTFTNGNLNWTSPAIDQRIALSSISVSSNGKWYMEATMVSKTATYYHIGIFANPQKWDPRIAYRSDGARYIDSDQQSGNYASYDTNDIIGIAFDSATSNATFYKNGTLQGTMTAGAQATGNSLFFGVTSDGSGGTGTYAVNFGQRPFAYTAPSGHITLNSKNITPNIASNSSSTIANSYFGMLTYTGNGTQNTGGVTNVITGLNFTPDLVWIKSRNNGRFWATIDSVRGARKVISIANGNAEHTDASGLASFNSGGLTFDGGGYYDVNFSDSNLIAFCWKANGSSTVTNTNGGITSQVSANPTAGFSIVTYTGSGSNSSVGHGLGAKPAFIMVKARSDNSRSTITWHKGLTGSNEQDRYAYMTASAAGTTSNYWGTTGLTTSTFGVWGTGGDNNNSSTTFVAYCWSEVGGFSRFGNYTGNGSADGPFVYCGFRPAFVIVKRLDNSYDWKSWNSGVSSYNPNQQPLWLNLANAEGSASHNLDMLSNGFKIRSTDAIENSSDSRYIFCAWAANPFKYARAR